MPLADFTAFTPSESPCSRRMVLAFAGIEPLLGFPLSRVFPPAAMQSALHRPLLPGAFAEARSAELPRRSERLLRFRVSLAPGDGITSLEVAFPS